MKPLEQPGAQLFACEHSIGELPQLRQDSGTHELAAALEIEIGALTIKLSTICADNCDADQVAIQKIRELRVHV